MSKVGENCSHQTFINFVSTSAHFQTSTFGTRSAKELSFNFQWNYLAPDGCGIFVSTFDCNNVMSIDSQTGELFKGLRHFVHVEYLYNFGKNCAWNWSIEFMGSGANRRPQCSVPSEVMQSVYLQDINELMEKLCSLNRPKSGYWPSIPSVSGHIDQFMNIGFSKEQLLEALMLVGAYSLLGIERKAPHQEWFERARARSLQEQWLATLPKNTVHDKLVRL